MHLTDVNLKKIYMIGFGIIVKIIKIFGSNN